MSTSFLARIEPRYRAKLASTFTPPAVLPTPISFRVRVKLNSKEAARRFDKIVDSFPESTATIAKLCRQLERDGRLERTLSDAEQRLRMTADATRAFSIGERQYLGEIVLYIEGIMDEAQDLLRKARLYTDVGGSLKKKMICRARELSMDINASLCVLKHMREVAYEDFSKVIPEQDVSSTWRRRLCSWIRPQRVSVPLRQEEHHQREHLFGTDKGSGRPC